MACLTVRTPTPGRSLASRWILSAMPTQTSIRIHGKRQALSQSSFPWTDVFSTSDAERANLAKQRGIEVIHGYLTSELAGTLGSFDAVIFADVLEHLADPLLLLYLGCSFLAPHGVA